MRLEPRANARWTLAFARVTSSFLILSFAPAFAQDAEQSRLNTVERDIKRSESERDRLFQQQQDVTRDLDTVRRDLVTLARDIQDQEYSLLVLESRLTDLGKEEQALQGRLGARDEQMGRVLLALERLALRPGDALSLSPLNPADAVRTAILLRAAVPSVRSSAQELQAELAELFAVRAQMTAQKEQIALAAGALVGRRAELEKLEQERTAKQTQLASATSEATLRLEQMAREAEDLRELLEKLNAEKKKRQEEERLKAEAAAKAKAEAEAAEAARRAKELAEKPPPPPGAGSAPESPPLQAAPDLAPLVAELRPFSEARGSMPFPVAGSVSQLYGDSDASTGLSSRGLSIKSRPSAPVIAPFDGVVAFAGPFRAYGLLLIIEHSEGYHTLLAGLGRVDATVGQRVLAGEPVGSMDNEGTPSLYVELRRDGQPVNPLPWLASRTGKKSG